MINRIFSTTVVITAALAASASAANLLSNPSFESGSGAVTFSGSTEFGGASAFDLTSPSSEIPGWVWEQTPAAPGDPAGGAAWLEDTGNLFGTDGDHLLYLDQNQCIQWHDTAALVADEEYILDFNIASWTRGQDASPTDPTESGDSTLLIEYNYVDGGGTTKYGTYTLPSEIVAPANGSSAPADLTWLSDSYYFTVPADYASDYKFVLTATGGMVMDNLAINAVPEPSSIGLIGLSLAAMLLRRKRD